MVCQHFYNNYGISILKVNSHSHARDRLTESQKWPQTTSVQLVEYISDSYLHLCEKEVTDRREKNSSFKKMLII